MPERHDAIVVGSGATGGWAAMGLTQRGLRVALIEAGPHRDQTHRQLDIGIKT